MKNKKPEFRSQKIVIASGKATKQSQSQGTKHNYELGIMNKKIYNLKWTIGVK